MRKVGLSANKFTAVLISVLIAFCVLWGGLSIFVPMFGRAEDSAEVTPIQAELKSLGIEDYRDKLASVNIGQDASGNDVLVPIVLGGEKEGDGGTPRPWTNAEIAAEWSRAITEAGKDSDKYVYVKLEQDWVAQAPSEGEMPVFGVGVGFCTRAIIGVGALEVSARKIIFDLNGYILDRNLKDTEYNSSAVFVESAKSDFVIVDGNPNKAHEGKRTVKDPNKPSYDDTQIEVDKYSYKSVNRTTDVQYEYKPVIGGIITGGRACHNSQWNAAFGGGIRILNGHVHLIGGTIFGNESNNGDGIYANTTDSPTDAVVIDGGNIIGNKSFNTGGGIQITSKSRLVIKCGNICDNTATSGGGIYTSAVATIYGGNIMYNYANQGGGVYLNANDQTNPAMFTLSGGSISDNNAYMGGGIYSTSANDINTPFVVVEGGKIEYNSATLGGAMYLLTSVKLSGGRISHNITGGYYGDNGSGLYFHDKANVKYKLFLAGPVALTQNGSESDSDPKFSVYSNLRGNVNVYVTGNLSSGSGADLQHAEIYISNAFCPIHGYDDDGMNRDESGNLIEPGTYFHFTYVTPDPGNVVLDTMGIMYSTPFTTEYYGSDDGNNYDTLINLDNASYGTRFYYGANGQHGIKVKVKSESSSNYFLDFTRYVYAKELETSDVNALTKYDEDSYADELIKDVGIYIGEGRIYGGGISSDITIRVIVCPRSLESQTVAGDKADNVNIVYDAADKPFDGTEIKPTVTSVKIDTGEGNDPWFEAVTYEVAYENNIHVAGNNYVVVKGTGNYGGTVKLPFNIVQHATNTYAMDGAQATVWEFFDGTEWKTVGTGPSLTYNDADQKYSVRAKVSSKFESGANYVSYVYAEGCVKFNLADGDTVLVDPGLTLKFAKGDAAKSAVLFDAGTYTVTVEEVNAEKGMIGDFKLPEQEIASAVVMSPYAITEQEMMTASAEKENSMLAVSVGDEYIPFISEVSYIENDVIKTNAESDKFKYVMYNGKAQTIALNPEYNIDLSIFKRAFSNYITGTPVIAHTVGGAAAVTVGGAVNTVTTVTTTVTYVLNGNFSYMSNNTVTLTKTWCIVTGSNVITLENMESEFVYGTNGAVALAEQQIEDNDMYVGVAKSGGQTRSIVVSQDKLYEYSASAPDHRGDRIESTLREYLDNYMAREGVGKYTIHYTAPDFASKTDGKNGAIYHAASVTKPFTVVARSIEDPDNGVAVSVSDAGVVYDGTEKAASVTLLFGGKTLVKDTDYTLEYENNVHAGDRAQVTVTGIGNYTGKVVRMFTVAPATDNTWTTSLNIASWVTGAFNRNISVIKGETKYGNADITFGIVPSEEVASKLSAEDVEALKTIEVNDGVISAEAEEILLRLPVGEYTLTATMAQNNDYNAVPSEFKFNVLSAQYAEPKLNSITGGEYQNMTFTGSMLSMNIVGFDNAAMQAVTSAGLYFDANGGTVYATNAGEYTIRLSLKSDECSWMDGTRDDIMLTWKISPRVVKAPQPSDKKYIYNGNVQSYMPEYFDPVLMYMENDERTDAGQTFVTIYLKDSKNYVWDDGTSGARVYSWEIVSVDWIYYTVIGVLGGCVLIAVMFAIGQYFKHRARMKDLAEAQAEADKNNNEGGNA